MAYQAKRQKQFQEDLELCDENGTVVETLHVNIDADSMARKISMKYRDMCRTLASTQEMKQELDRQDPEQLFASLERLGQAVVELFQAVFGEEDTKTIVTFYENRYIEMCEEITPFISQVVIPRCIEIKNQNQKRVLQSYDRKRTLFGK